MKSNNKIINLSAVGLDAPGLVSKITTNIFEMKGNIIDVEENCRRGLFSIFLIIDFAQADKPIQKIIAALQEIETAVGLKIIVSSCGDRPLAYSPATENHLVTIIGIDQPGIIAKISTFFYRHTINIEKCKMIARGNFFSMEMVIDTKRMRLNPSESRLKALEKMKFELKELCADINQSVVIQSENIYKRTKKLVVFDVESTLVEHGSLQKFLEKVRGRVQTVDGRLDCTQKQEDQMQALIDNAKLLKGISLKEFETFSSMIQLNPGAFELIKILKTMGFKIALLSSGFNFFIKQILEQGGVDYAFFNTLKSDENGLTTGELEEPIITYDTKDELLQFILDVEQISPDQVIAVGDGSSCSHFIQNVGLSIAFKPNGARVDTDGVLSSDQIINILYCLGIPKSELDKYL
jgi:phosphoserine phosphatase